MTFRAWVVLGCLSMTFAAAQPPEARGVVYLDADGDGVRDPGERGIAGVAVSDQIAVTSTDADGSYLLPGGAGEFVFVSLPRGHRAVNGFWRRRATAASIDFGLQTTTDDDSFAFIHASDSHTDPQSAPRLTRVREIASARKAAFVLVTGDLARTVYQASEADARRDYQLYQREVGAFTMPVWSVPGNHDHFAIERATGEAAPHHPLRGRALVRSFLGPSYYSFNSGAIHFVALDTVSVAGTTYYGNVDPGQLVWLERDLALVPPETTVVTFNHIPFFSAGALLDGLIEAPASRSIVEINGRTVFRHVVTNAADVLRVLRTRRHVLALGGHVHLRERIAFEVDGVQTRFEQASAIVGPRPNANQSLTFRSGVTVYRVNGRGIDEGEFVPLDGTPYVKGAAP
jgi:hypothetical protein